MNATSLVWKAGNKKKSMFKSTLQYLFVYNCDDKGKGVKKTACFDTFNKKSV